MTRLLLLTALTIAAACGGRTEGPPAIEVDRTACAHCGMLISEPVYAAALRAPGSEARVFDDIGCLLDALQAEADVERLALWVHDTESGDWIDARQAVFVRSAHLTTPMGGGVIAFRDAPAAQAAAERHAGEVIESFRALSAPAASTSEENRR